MKLIKSSFESGRSLMAHDIISMKPRQIENPLSEDDILYLQHLFLSNGLHAIQLPNVAVGRTVIYTLLRSLDYYHTVACLTCVAEPPLKRSIFDVNSAAHLATRNADSIAQFFTERFFADFLWIELTESLARLPAFMDVIEALDSLALGSHIPVVALCYNS